MPTLRSAWVWVDMSPHTSAANTDTVVIKPVPVAGTIREVHFAIVSNLATGGGIMTLHKNAVNILSSTNIDLEADLGDAVAETNVLTTNNSALEVTTTDCLRAGYTLTTLACTDNAIGVLVAIEPALW